MKKDILYINNVDDIRIIDMLRVSKKEEEHDYSKDYLTLEALENGSFSIVFQGTSDYGGYYITRSMRESFSYSVDNGENWVTFETPSDTYTGTALTTPLVVSGQKVLLKGIGKQNMKSGPSTAMCYITSTGEFNVSGNIMSLLYGDNYLNQTTFPQNSNSPFNSLFRNCSKLISAENLILPDIELIPNCYSSLFHGCSALTTPPALPSTTLANYCYTGMFDGCTSLTTAPELPATTLAGSCYQYMFDGCTSLTTAPELPATTLVNNCYQEMFSGCTNLNYIKAMFTTEPSSSYTLQWVYNVAASGTFVKNSAATWDVTGTSGVPSGWTVQTADS